MPHRQNDPLRPLTADERAQLAHLSRSHREPAAHVARATALLTVADGHRFTEAAQAAGRRSGDAIAHLVAWFNREGLPAPEPGHGGGQPKRYTQTGQGRDGHASLHPAHASVSEHGGVDSAPPEAARSRASERGDTEQVNGAARNRALDDKHAHDEGDNVEYRREHDGEHLHDDGDEDANILFERAGICIACQGHPR